MVSSAPTRVKKISDLPETTSVANDDFVIVYKTNIGQVRKANRQLFTTEISGAPGLITDVETLQDDVSTIFVSLSVNRVDLEFLSTSISNVEASVSTLNVELTSLEERVSANELSVANLNNRVSIVEASLNNINQRLTNVEATVDEHSSLISNLRASVSTINNRRSPYLTRFFVPNTPTSLVAMVVHEAPVIYQPDFAGSRVAVRNEPTSACNFRVLQRVAGVVTSVGTIFVSAGGSIATVSTAATVSYGTGDVMEVRLLTSANGLENMAVAFRGERVSTFQDTFKT